MRTTHLLFLLLFGVSSAFGQVTADFLGFPRTTCNPPYEVTFQNLSVGDTAWLWDFGDGNTSFFPNPIHLYAAADTYSVQLIAFGPTGSDTVFKEDYIIAEPPLPPPTLNKTGDTISCGTSTTFIASSNNDNVWYDASNDVVYRGDTLDVAFITNPISFFVRAEELGTIQKVGPSDHLEIGNGGFFNGDRGLQFNVYSDIILRSVLVNSGGAGTRTIELQDTFGVILQTLDVFIPAGVSRINLNLELLPGNYRLMGDNMNLFRNNTGIPNYPYEVPGLVEIVNSTAGPNFYYFFYDWEVATFCKSSFERVDVDVTGVTPPVISQDTVTVNCGAAGQLIATAPDEVNWYDASGNFLSIGDTLDIPFVGGTATYTARNIGESASFKLGPEDPDSVGPGGFHNIGFFTYMSFDVSSDIRLKSVKVQAIGAGPRTITLRDAAGTVLQSVTATVPNGRSRVDLNFDLTPGSYQLGGTNMNLFRNNNSAVNYPFTLPGLASITGTSFGSNLYYYFYDWDVAIVCISEPDTVVLELEPPLPPSVPKVRDTVSCGASSQFTASGSNPNHWYTLANDKVFVGDTLDLPAVTQNASYLVRAEAESAPTKLGPANPSSLTGGGHFNFNQGLEFTVYADMKLKSILVDAGSAGNRDILLEDAQGNLLQTITVFIPNGRSRVQLDLEIGPGDYRLMGNNMDLWRNTAGASYPYSVPGLVDITGSTAQQAGYYYFYYDWEVAAICKSPTVRVNVFADRPTPPVINHDTLIVPCGNQAQFIATANDDISWYNPLGTEIAQGDTLIIPFAAAAGNYTAVQRSTGGMLSLGASDPDSLGGGIFINSNNEEWLFFTVNSEIVLQSVWVESNAMGMRDIEIRQTNGVRVATRSVMIPTGKSRVMLNIELAPGNYQIGGTLLRLFANENTSPAYPYNLIGVAQITSSSGGSDRYNFFYDWEISTICSSDPDVVYLALEDAVPPVITPASITLNCTDSVQFVGSGANIQWYDDQGSFLLANDTLTIDRVKSNTSYSANNILESPSFFGGPSDPDEIGDGDMHNFNFQTRLYFTTLTDLTLKSVWVNAATAGNRDIILEDGSGNPLDTLTINIPAGASRITLDWVLAAGNYRIGGANMNLYRNDDGVNYPYDVASLVSITGSSVGPNFYYYFYDWELGKTCISDTVTVTVDFVPVDVPTVANDSISIVCNGVDTLIANGTENIVWYNPQGDQVATGDSLFINLLKDSTTYYAVNETSGNFIKGGEFDNTFGRGGFTQTPGEWIVFDVHQDVILKSVKVFARSAGNRTIQYRDNLGNIIDSMTVNIPTGESRVELNFPLQIGNDQQLAVSGNVDLFRNNENVAYPYHIGSFVTLTKSNAILPFVFYHYFYDWEVGDPGCQSQAVPVFVDVQPFATPMVTHDDTICYNETGIFNTNAGAGAWLDPTGNLVGYGTSFTTNPITSGGTYNHIGESVEIAQKVGPADATAVGPGGYHNATFDAFLEFTVDVPIRLNSFWVDAEVGGVRDIVLQDGNGSTLQTIRKLIPAGAGRVYLGLELEPGDYAIGGNSMRLYRNDNGASYPYDVAGVISLTGSSTGSNFYYYFYDWEVQDIPCQSDTVAFDLAVRPQIVPFFTSNQMDSTVNFNNVSVPLNASYFWDFGDGDTSVLEDPTHTYADTGFFVVTLTVSNGNCEESYTDSIYIAGPMIGIEDDLSTSLRLFPNPGNGRFTIEASTSSLKEMQVVIFDLKGRKIYQSALQRSLSFQEEVDLSNHPAGTYMVQLRAEGAQVVRRYVLMK
jgi:PKD repeat protein